MNQTDRTLWTEWDEERSIQCVMRSCCAGAELQILSAGGPGHESTVVLRELYPTKSDLYERARALASHYRNEAAGRQALSGRPDLPSDSVDGEHHPHRSV